MDDENQSQELPILDCEDFTVFTDAMELHYVDMKAFAKAVNESGGIDIDGTDDAMFAKWLSIITQKEITDKSIIEKACRDEEDISMAVSTLARQGQDKYARQAYQRRKDEIFYYNKKMKELEESKKKLEAAEAALAENKTVLAEKETVIAESKTTIAEQEKIIAELRAQLEKSKATQ